MQLARKKLAALSAAVQRHPIVLTERARIELAAGNWSEVARLAGLERRAQRDSLLMAHEMDERIRASTNGTKRLRDALRALVAWSGREKRGFRIDELPGIFKDATGVDTAAILERWLSGMSGPGTP